MNNIKDLTKEAPRSPYEQINGFALLPRAIDKCRASIVGKNGDYHSNCPLDQVLFTFKGIDAKEFRAYVGEGHSDEEIGEWVINNGITKTADEISAWSNAFRTDFSYATNPEKKDWFFGECEKLGLDPETTTLLDYLEVDDKATFLETV